MVNRGLLNWGVFLLAAGGVMLLAQSDVIDRGLIAQALGLWPLIVIALGAKLLLRRTPLATASGAIAAAMPGLLLGGLVVAIPNMTPACHIAQSGTFAGQQGTFEGSASAELRISCGDLTVTTTPGSGWQVQTGESGGAAPVLESGGHRLYLASSSQRFRVGSSFGGDSFRVVLPTANSIDLTADVNAGRGTFDLANARLGRVELTLNAGEATLDLTGATLSRLTIDLNAAGATVRLPDADFGGDLSVNAGRLSICVPPGLGLRIHQKVVLGSANTEGLIRTGGALETPNYALALHHADVTISVNVGSVDINPAGGCK
jgi:hypothetical protein